MNNIMWIVHRPTGARMRYGAQDGTLWQPRNDHEARGEFAAFADAVAEHAKTHPFTDSDLALELLDAERSPCCFGVNQARDSLK